MKVLRWKKAAGSAEDMPHELRVHENDHGGLKVALVIRKESNQFLELTIPDGEVGTFLEAWNSQAGHNYWSEEMKETGEGYFFIVRFFPYRTRWVVWRVEHVNNRPNDSLTTFDGTRSEMLAFYAR